MGDCLLADRLTVSHVDSAFYPLLSGKMSISFWATVDVVPIAQLGVLGRLVRSSAGTWKLSIVLVGF